MEDNLTSGFFMQLFAERLREIYDEKEIRNIIYILFEHYLNWPKTLLHLEPGKKVPAGESALLMQALERLGRNEPVQYITGNALFRGLQFKVGPGVLIPRQETEQLVDLAAREELLLQGNDPVILDIGTGSGCIAISLKKEFPRAAVHACDNSQAALAFAEENAKKNGTGIRFIHTDILNKDQWKDLPAADLVVCNPPYITPGEKKMMHPNVLEYEPETALFVPADDPLIFYRAVAAFASKSMKRPGILWFEINELYGNEVKKLLVEAGFTDPAILKDLNSKDRFARAVAGN